VQTEEMELPVVHYCSIELFIQLNVSSILRPVAPV